MRLIDADELKLCYTGSDTNKSSYLSIRKMIDTSKTTYDIDKVVEELEKTKTINVDVGFGTIYKTIRKDVAIEIVKHGCVAVANNATVKNDDVCEWKVFDNSLTGEPQWVYETTCGKYVGEEHTSKAFVYCPYCGKKIKVVE